VPGLLGAVDGGQGARADGTFEILRAAMRRSPRVRFESAIDRDGRWAIGRTHLRSTARDAQRHDVEVLVDGDVAVDVVRAAYASDGAAFPGGLTGPFAIARVDRIRGRILIASDPFASHPVYWVCQSGRLRFASELRALLRCPGVDRTLDARAMSDLLHCGFVFGDRTLAEGISLVPPGSVLTFDWNDGTHALSRYHEIPALFEPAGLGYDEYVGQVCDAFGNAVQRALGASTRPGLSLSGGLDSRAVLSAVNGHRDVLTTYTVGVEKCADDVIARQLASVAGTTHRFERLDATTTESPAFLSGLERMVGLTDGMYLTHGLTELTALALIEHDQPDVLLRGHGGELAKASLAWPFHADGTVAALANREAIVDHLAARLSFVRGTTTLQDLLTPEWLERTCGGIRTSIAESLAGITLEPADTCTYLYLTQHHRRATIPSLELFRGETDVRVPFVDHDFLRVLFRGRPEWRRDTALHRAIIARFRPELLRVRNSNTGVAAGAGPLREALFDKINTLLRRLGVPGYRHYHAFKEWMQQTFLPAASHVLLDPVTMQRGIFREDTVRRLLDETSRGVADHAYLLQGLLILELWQRDNS
jgi:asparagine synthase (glutamine-hydrolysing)